MDDAAIIDLYLHRDEKAIRQTEEKYGQKLTLLALNITDCILDAEECVNDTYLQAWNSIPPTIPTYFFAYLAKITRHLSYHVYNKKHAKKRSAILVELSECIPSKHDTQKKVEAKELSYILDSFIRRLPANTQIVFMRRYFWADSIHQIASLTNMSESKIKSILFRTRKNLKNTLQKEGYST